MIFSWDKNLPWQMEIEKGFNLHYKGISSKPTLFIDYMAAILIRPNDVKTMDSKQLTKKFYGFFYDWRL